MLHDIPGSLADLTPEWFTAVLNPAFPGVKITAAEVTGTLHGSAAKARVLLSAEGAPGVPPSVIVKASFTEGLGEDHLAQAWIPLMAMMNETEGQFYLGSADLMGDRCPRCFHAAAHGTSSALVLEDLNNRENLRFGAFDEPLSRDDMASVLAALAQLHAVRWDDPDLVSAPLRDSFLEGGMLDGFLSEVNWDQQMARPRGKLVPVELTDHGVVTAAIKEAWAAKRSGPQSLIHGDPHIGNYFFDTAGAGLLDWQLFTSGHWASDVVYAVASAMDIEERRRHEQDLLRHYLEHIQARTKNAPSWNQAWADYRKFAIWGVAALLTPGEGVQVEEYNSVVGERHARAAVDLDSMSALHAASG